MPNEIDILVTDAVGAAATRPDAPDYIRPAELAAATGLPMQTVGLRVGRLFAVTNIRHKGYHTASLTAAYRAHLEREESARERLALELQTQETEAAAMRARLEDVKRERQALEAEQRRLQREIKTGNEDLAKEVEREEAELLRQQAETRKLNRERERQRQVKERQQQPIPTGIGRRRKGQPRR